MTIESQDYSLIVKQIIKHQEELIPIIEEAVQVIPHPNLLSSTKPELIAIASTVSSNKKVHQIIRDWPDIIF
jgi:hypothetical protein